MNLSFKLLANKLSGLIIMLSLFFILNCTEEQKSSPPDIAKYTADTNLMVNVAQKFIDDPDAKKVHEVAVATEQTRAMACFDYNNECTLYGELISKIIATSADGTVTPAERQSLLQDLAELRSAIKGGLNKLRREN